MSRDLSRRLTLGAGGLLSVMLLVLAAAVLLGAYYTERADAESRAEDREAGRVFAFWFHAAHRASMDTDCNAVPPATDCASYLAQLGQGLVLSVADLRNLDAAPVGLPDTAGRSAPFTVGIIDDGAGVPMAFGVIEPRAWAHSASLRAGVIEGDVAQVAEYGDPDSEMAFHRAAIATAMGRTPANGVLFVTADRGVRYRDDSLYRRAQPGQRRLNRMETTLNAGGCGAAHDEPCDLTEGGPLTAVNVIATPDPGAPVASTVGGDGDVNKATEAGSMISETLLGQAVEGITLTVDAALTVGSSESDTVVTADMDVDEHAQAAAVTGTSVTALDAAVETAVSVSGSSTIGTLSAATLTMTGELATGAGVFQGLYGPSARFQTLTVGSCAGCYPE